VPSAVIAARYYTLKAPVVDRVVLYHHREALLLRVQRGALWDGPGLEDAVDFQANIVVEAPRGVLLNDKLQAAALGRLGGRLGLPGMVKIPLALISLKHRYASLA
jgi:hypothetical protein